MVLLKRQAAAAAASRLQNQGHSASGPSTEVKRDSDHPMQDDTETKPNTAEENANVQQAVQNAIPVRNTTLPFFLILITCSPGPNASIMGLCGRGHADPENCFPLVDHEHGDYR